jgi:hypothetical protein
MKTQIGLGAILLGVGILVGCSGKPSVHESTSENESSKLVAHIIFDFPGDDIGGQDAQAVLERVKTTILNDKVGEIISSGFGMGKMEIVLTYEKDDSLAEIRKVIESIYPGGRYRIERRNQ